MSKEIVALMLQHEKAVAALYEACAERFPDEEEFFRTLAAEEIGHADVISKLSSLSNLSGLELYEARFKTRPLEVSLDYVNEATEKIKADKATLVGALAIAASIENSIIESKYHELFIGLSPQFISLLEKMHRDTLAHNRKINALLDKYRKERHLS